MQFNTGPYSIKEFARIEKNSAWRATLRVLAILPSTNKETIKRKRKVKRNEKVRVAYFRHLRGCLCHRMGLLVRKIRKYPDWGNAHVGILPPVQ